MTVQDYVNGKKIRNVLKIVSNNKDIVGKRPEYIEVFYHDNEDQALAELDEAKRLYEFISSRNTNDE